MALWIQNVTPDDRPDSEPHDYIVRINQRELARFKHVRALGASECLRAAADAIDKASIGRVANSACIRGAHDQS